MWSSKRPDTPQPKRTVCEINHEAGEMDGVYPQVLGFAYRKRKRSLIELNRFYSS